jgi:Chaperone for flagella basal body P-ring formation
MNVARKLPRFALFLTLGALAFVTNDAAAEEIKERALSRQRVLLSDVVDGAPADLATIDLGPSPAPGSSRLIKRDEIDAALANDSDRKRVKFSAAIRVVRKTKPLSVVELEKLTTTAIKGLSLPKGVTFLAARPKSAVRVPDGFDTLDVEMARFPHREGKHSTTVTLVLRQGDDVIAKVPVSVDFKLGPEAAIADVKKGEKVQFIVRRGQIEIRATASANTDADVGDLVQVTVSDSGKVLKGRLSSINPPLVMEAQ